MMDVIFVRSRYLDHGLIRILRHVTQHFSVQTVKTDQLSMGAYATVFVLSRSGSNVQATDVQKYKRRLLKIRALVSTGY